MSIRFAVIGAGNRGHDVYGETLFARKGDGLQVVAVAEPDPEKRARMSKRHGVAPQYSVSDWSALLEHKKAFDALIIATPDRHHVGPALAALTRGVPILLEKPMATSPEECVALVRAAETAQSPLLICHVLRYTPFFSKLKELIDQGCIGDVVSIEHAENIGFWHFAHSYVRGNWRSSQESSPIMLAKCCHDLDLLVWLSGSRVKRVSSFGGLTHFKSVNAPSGAPMRCTQGCPVEQTCNYSALKVYAGTNIQWPVSTIATDLSLESRIQAIEEGPYGRCVYRSDNDVCDHQVVALEFESGATAAFTMSAFTADNSRAIKVMGTQGELSGDLERWRLEWTSFKDGNTRSLPIEKPTPGPGDRHAGGDRALMEGFIRVLQSNDPQSARTTARLSLESHLLAFAAEESRCSGQVIEMRDFYAKLHASDLR